MPCRETCRDTKAAYPGNFKPTRARGSSNGGTHGTRLTVFGVSFLVILFLFANKIHGPRDLLLLQHGDDSTDAVALLHNIEGIVDLCQCLAVRDELVDLELAVKVVPDQTGELAAALDAAESTALPHPTSDELECCAGLIR